MRFDNIIEHALNNTSLKKVRMKMNPSENISANSTQPYEGYIIEENDGMLKIMMLAPEPGHEITSIDNVEPSSGDTLEQFKDFIQSYISSKNRCEYDQSLHDSISRVDDIQQLEMIMKEHGIESSEFQHIIKLYIMS